MPITYEVDRDRRLMITRVSGKIMPSDVVAYLDTIIADPENENCDELIILNEIDLDAITSADVRGFARRAADLTEDEEFRVAVVAPSDADFGLFRMFQTFRELGEERMAVHRTLELACDWLGVKVPEE